jgi:hypothetical protein
VTSPPVEQSWRFSTGIALTLLPLILLIGRSVQRSTRGSA